MALPWTARILFALLYIICLFCLHQYVARRLLGINPWISCLFGFVSIIMAPIFVDNSYYIGEAYISVFSVIFVDIYRWSYISSQLNNQMSRNNKFIQFVYKKKAFCNIIVYLLVIVLMIYNFIFIAISLVPNDGNYFPFFNLLCGTVLMFTLIIPLNDYWSISHYNAYNKEYSDLVVSVDVLWIILFCSYNLNFILYSYFEFFLESFCLISSSILCILFTKRSDLWFSSRFYILAINAWIRCITANNMHYLINNGTSNKDKFVTFVNIWAAVNFVAALLYTVYLVMFMWSQRHKTLHSKNNQSQSMLSHIVDNVTEEESDDLSTENESSTSNGINDNQQSEANFDKSTSLEDHSLLLDE